MWDCGVGLDGGRGGKGEERDVGYIDEEVGKKDEGVRV